jgi:thiamine-phosphate pyrophosphorylase
MRALPSAPFLYAIVDAALAGGRSLTEWVELVAGPRRASIVQWRAKALTDAQFIAGAREVQVGCRRLGVPFIVNDRPDVAKILGAEGVHVGQDDLPPDEVRRLLPSAIIGVSTHCDEELTRALATSADYIAVGPVFETASKRNPDPVVGLDFVGRAAVRLGSRPVVAIGGITASTARAAIVAGASGVAVISPLMGAHDPETAAIALAATIKGAAHDRSHS